MTNVYDDIHEFFNHGRRFLFPYEKADIEKLTDLNGLYILFENRVSLF
jgi:hypothetical protein